MAAYINRTISMMAGHEGVTTPRGGIVSNSDSRVINSPLQIFVKAKKQINDIFVEVEDYVKDTVLYMQNLKKEHKIASQKDIDLVVSYIDKVNGIREVLKRDHMKVAFFGRTSNGKSSVINAMLREKILPSGIGHTTNCFLQVEGSENEESYLLVEGSNTKQNVETVVQLGHALCKEKLVESQLVKIFWPKDKCLLLRDDVVFVDSPGIDVSPNLDDWIDKHCLDADVFVLVANAESTLMVTEKNFFHKVSSRLSKPNIFVLNNRWDASAAEPEFLDGVRYQHMERTVDFLVKELKVCTQKEAQERIFFVSAKETLQARLCEKNGKPAHSGALAEGFSNRYFEFQDFEKKFEECISKSAVKTKFEQHSQRGKLIASDIRNVMDNIYENTLRLKSEKAAVKKSIYEKLNFTEQQLLLLTQEMKEKINHITDDVEQRVSKALHEEIRRLSVLVDEFNLPFSSEPLVLNIYKKEIHSHVENGLGNNLRMRLTTAMTMNIENSQKEMTERMMELLPDEKKQPLASLLPRKEPFQILYRLNCNNLCADFHEDLEFRFSWGLTAIISKFTGKSGHKMALTNYKSKVPSLMSTPDNCQELTNEVISPVALNSDWSLISKLALASVSSQGTMGVLLFSGVLMKSVGWRVILVTGALYGCVYLYERYTWTNKAKERTFKKQYVSHATKKLKMIVDLTSANCSHQVQQELSSTFARLCHLVDESTVEMDKKIKVLDKELRELDEFGNNAKVLRNKANYVLNELGIFEEKFLKDCH